MKKKRIYYSIDVECKDKDAMNFMRLNHPGENYIYSHIEEIKEEDISKEDKENSFKYFLCENCDDYIHESKLNWMNDTPICPKCESKINL